MKYRSGVHDYSKYFKYVYLDLWSVKRMETCGINYISSLLLMISLEECGPTPLKEKFIHLKHTLNDNLL